MSEQERRDCIADCDGPSEIVESDQTGPVRAWQVDHCYYLEATIGQDADDYFLANLTLGQAYERLGELIQAVEDQAEPFDIRILSTTGNLLHHVWVRDCRIRQWSDHRSPFRFGRAS